MASQGQNYTLNPGPYPPQYPPQYPTGQHQPGYYQGPSPQPAPPGQYPGYPPGQAYYQPGYTVQGSQMHTVIQQPVIIQQPVTLQHVPVSMQCPYCRATIVTKLDHRVGSTTFIYCCMLSLIGCCCVPFCTQCAKDVAHTCPNCNKELGVFTRPLVEKSDGSYRRGQNYDRSFGGPADDYVPPSDD